MLAQKRPLKKTYKKVKLSEQKSDFEYWQSQPIKSRLAALEEIRQEYHQWKYDTQPRFERVLSIIKR